ncbi:MAG: HPF/RaiA family ribosome-associated protein [Rhodospirillaceae bacterium]
MQVPVQISFHGLDSSEAVETRIREKVAKLETYFDRITGCRVVVERHHRNTHASANGQPYHISIVLEVPGDELVVKRDPKRDESLKDHEDIQIALRDAFAAMERQLKDYTRRRREGRGGKDAAREVNEGF